MRVVLAKSMFDRTRTVALMSVFLLASVSACSSGSSSGPSDAATSKADTSLLGPDKAATGTSVKIGFAYDGASAAVDTSDQVVAARAAVKYANAKLGGLGGHKIELFECETKLDPTTDCGDRMVTQKVLAVVAGQMGTAQQVRKPLGPAGIPYVDSNNQVLGSDIDVSLSNPLLVVGGAAEFAKANGIKRTTLVVIDQAASVAQIKAFAPTLFGPEGVTVSVIGIPAGTADMTPQIQAAQSATNPQQFHLVGNEQFCASALKAIKTLGLSAKVTAINRCTSPKSAASIPGGYAGVTIITGINVDPEQPETKLYEAFRAAYLPGKDNGEYQTAYQAMIGFVRAVNGGNLSATTPAGVAAAIKAMPELPLPLGGGVTYQCNRLKVTVLPSACSTGASTAIADAQGKLSQFKVVDNPALYSASGG
jgi:branched-chain amino acid transport system substrate-binding protein